MGIELNGLPNPANAGATGESAYDLSGNILSPSEEGLDSEGIALAPDGTYWVNDEYGPHLVHFDKNGNTLEGLIPLVQDYAGCLWCLPAAVKTGEWKV